MKRFTWPLILAVALLLLSYCSSETSQPLDGAAVKQLERMPMELQGFAYANIERLRDSKLAQPLMDSLSMRIESEERLQEILDRTDFDIRRDVSEIYLAFGEDLGERDAQFVAVSVGKFNPQRLIDFARDEMASHEAEQIRESEYEGFVLYSPGERHMSLTFADQQHLVVGTTAHVKTWLDHYRNNDGRLSDAARQRLERLRYKQGAWMTLDAKQLFREALDQLADGADISRFGALRKVESFDISMDADDRLMMQGEGVFTDAENATLFGDALKGALATAKLSMTDDRKAIDVMNKIEVDAAKNAVTIGFELTRQDLELLKSRPDGMAWR